MGEEEGHEREKGGKVIYNAHMHDVNEGSEEGETRRGEESECMSKLGEGHTVSLAGSCSTLISDSHIS